MEGWENRLLEEIRNAAMRSKSMSELSVDMGFGRNYVSQMLKEGKVRIELPSFLKAVEKLGHASALYILFGTRVGDAETAAIIDVALGIKDAATKEAALSHLQGLREISDRLAQPSSVRE